MKLLKVGSNILDKSAIRNQTKIKTWNELQKELTYLKKNGKKIGLCHGVFDLLHPGHIKHFDVAKEKVDVLVVSLTADKFLNKGPGRPAFDQLTRAETLSHLNQVDYVVISPHETAIPIISLVKPNLYFKGTEYKNFQQDITGNIQKEVKSVKKYGGKIFFTNEKVYSSSNLINKYLFDSDTPTQTYFKNFRKKYSFNQIEDFFSKIKDLNILIVGETIIDEYTTAETLGKSSKDPILCMNILDSEQHAGGVLAIASHCLGLGAHVTVLTGINFKDLGNKSIRSIRKSLMDLQFIDISPKPTIKKNRIIDERTKNKVIEFYEMDDSPLSNIQEKILIVKLKKLAKKVDLIIVADYGHGLLNEKTIIEINNLAKSKSLNVQSNAGNRGFNNVSKYANADFISLNGGEIKLEARRKHLQMDSFVRSLRRKMKSKSILITKGSEGIEIFTKIGFKISSPSLAPFVKDRVGAGDTVFSIASALFAVGAPAEIIALCGNLAGAWSVSFNGNENYLQSEVILKQISSILK